MGGACGAGRRVDGKRPDIVYSRATNLHECAAEEQLLQALEQRIAVAVGKLSTQDMSGLSWCWRRGSYSPSHLAASCCAKMRKFKIGKRDLKIFIPCFLALFASAYSITMLFPFLPFLIEFLLPKVKEEDIGKYAGFIASSMFLGRFFGCYVWGALADKKGRKPVIIIGCLLVGLSSVAFGFSVKLYMAILFRFCVGLFNGVVGTVKAIISESSTDSTQAIGMSLIMCSFSLGMVVGPAVSGALADPIGQYNLTISDSVVRGFLTKFPFSLPCLVNLLVCLVAVVAVAIWMPETLGAKKSKSPASGDSSGKSSSVTDDKHELLHDKVDDVMCEEDSGIMERDTDLGTVDDKLPALQDGRSSDRTDAENVERNDEPVTMELRSECSDESNEDMDKGDYNEARDSELPRKHSSGKRRNSFLVPFYNRRASFTPSFFKPSLSLLRKHRRDRSARGRHQRLVFEEESETSPLPQQEAIEIEGEEGKEELKHGDREVIVAHKSIKMTARLAESLKKTLQNLKLFLTTRATLLSLMIYCIFSFAIIGFDEIYSLWAAAAPYLGGLGWTLHEIGISLAICGALFFPFTFTFPVFERRFGLVGAYQINCVATIICILLLPNLHLISQDRLNPLRWTLAILLLLIFRIVVGNVFVACALFINNSVTFDKLGEVNGLAHSLTAMLRTAAPVFSGSIFSVSLSKGARNFGFPIDYHLIFIIFSTIVLLCTALAACLPLSINKQKVDRDSGSEVSASSNKTDEDLMASSNSANGDQRL